MWLTRVFLERWPLVVVLIALTTLFGVVSAKALIVQRLPNTEQPTVAMRLLYSGASTTEIRDTIARPVEDQIAGSQDLLHVDTSVQTGSATVAAYFSLGSSADTDLTNVIEAFNAAKSQLPSDLVNPVIRIFDPNAATVVSIGLNSHAMTTSGLAALATGQIAPAIEQVGGVSNVLVAGNVQAAYKRDGRSERALGLRPHAHRHHQHVVGEQSTGTGRHRVSARPRDPDRRAR